MKNNFYCDKWGCTAEEAVAQVLMAFAEARPDKASMTTNQFIMVTFSNGYIFYIGNPVDYGGCPVRVLNDRNERMIVNWQSELNEGDYALYVFETGGNYLQIFYEVLGPLKDDDGNVYEGNLRVNGYSRLMPEGEGGHAFVGDILMPLSKDQFEQARAEGWKINLLQLTAPEMLAYGAKERLMGNYTNEY